MGLRTGRVRFAANVFRACCERWGPEGGWGAENGGMGAAVGERITGKLLKGSSCKKHGVKASAANRHWS